VAGCLSTWLRKIAAFGCSGRALASTADASGRCINGKIAGFGGGADHTSGFYGGTGSLSVPLAQQWGAQIDGGVGSFDGSGWSRGAGHLFWRDPSIGLLGAYGSYFHWNGIGALTIPRIGENVGRFAAEGEYYWSRWTVRGLAGYETVHLNVPNVANLPGLLSIPNRFFDAVSASYYVTDNLKLSIGHLYTFGRHGLTLGSEYGLALGGGRMASLFADALLAESGNNAVLAGLRIYFGQRDKSLIRRHREDDPTYDEYGGFNVETFQPFRSIASFNPFELTK
jgi:hypothetical protein